MKLRVKRTVRSGGSAGEAVYLAEAFLVEVSDTENALIRKYGLESRSIGGMTSLGILLDNAVEFGASDALTREERIVQLLEGLNQIHAFIANTAEPAREEDLSVPWTPP